MLSAVLKRLNATPALKYSLIVAGAAIWLFGLTDQLPDLVQMAKYVGISALMVAVAALV